MRELFLNKLKANGFVHNSKFKNNFFSRSFPCDRSAGKITWYTFTVTFKDGEYIPDFFVSHHFGNNYSEHRLTRGAILRLHDDILDRFDEAIDHFIYGEDD